MSTKKDPAAVALGRKRKGKPLSAAAVEAQKERARLPRPGARKQPETMGEVVRQKKRLGIKEKPLPKRGIGAPKRPRNSGK